MDDDVTRLVEIGRQAMEARGLLAEFPPEVLAEAEAESRSSAAAGGPLRDLRHLPWSSIDNDDSRDLDQLSAMRAEPDGASTLLVAIADVDAFVEKGTATDAHARANTTSVYTAAAVFHMLPEALSTDRTSLNAGVERLAMVVEMTVGPDGALERSDVYRARVFNRARLTYDKVGRWLEGKAPPPPEVDGVPGLEVDLRRQDTLALLMQRRRQQRGALTLETRGARPVFDGSRLVDLRPDETNRAGDLIQELMIAANSAVAEYLERAGLPSIRRVLRAPARWDRIVALAKGLGETLPPAADAPSLESFLARRRQADPRAFPDLSLSVVKLLGGGEYVVGLPSEISHDHFGLAVRDYAHSTAPNRRFPDLVTQRLLKCAMDRRPAPYSEVELRTLAEHCTRQEDNAAKVERQVSKSAAALLLSSRIGHSFEAVVTGASPKGTWVRISRPEVEGKVVRGASGLDVGDQVAVRLSRTDVERGLIDFVA